MKIGLALSGGGILGVAHIGTLEQIEKNKIKIDMISGTSAGAIMGALFAVGGTSKIDTFLYELKLNRYFSPKEVILSFSPTKLFENMKAILKYYLPTNIENLPIKTYISATDIATGENVIYEKGNLIRAVMASSAFPGVFTSQEIKGQSVMDGGITNNLPAKILRERGADYVIGSSLHRLRQIRKFHRYGISPGRLESSIRAIDILQKELTEYEMKECDFCFVPPVEDYAKFRIDKVDEIKEIGRKNAKANIDDLLKRLKIARNNDII